ncbi:hypothetical protein GLOIN_2v1868421 [Rhizophagus clarus]|uniref:BTB domain-containing protein n=1 Tax=Rhizophagus clarus TaxID=94130 RepID=A0A8H3R3J8_9GLOM|nr:hypothetical protein GLOIN_2v1868421 [Rhizophagus clarus]
MKVTLQNCSSLVRFLLFGIFISSTISKTLDNQLYDTNLDPDSASIYNTLRPRKILSPLFRLLDIINRSNIYLLWIKTLYFKMVKKNVHIKLPNISPEIFQIVLEYIYGGILSLDDQDTLNFLKILAAADKLCLQELVNYLQKYLIENNSDWMEQHFEFTQQISSQSNNLLELQEFCTNLMVQSPEKIFKSFDFALLSEKSLISLIKRDDLQMKEIEIWENVLKWGLAQNPTLIPDPATWTNDDFEKMKSTLQNCLPLVRFFCLSSKEFSYKVRPYRKLLTSQFYEDLLNSYLDPDSVSTYNTLSPRKIISSIVQIIDSQIVDASTTSTILNWINKTVDNKSGTDEIIGGYNPLTWESSDTWVKNTKRALNYSRTSGPFFGGDIIIYNSNNEYTNYNNIWCRKYHYEKKIRETEDKFSMDDYEVFQIKKN